MRISLVLCPQANPDKPPLSLAYLAASLTAQGMQVNCFDFNIELFARVDEGGKKLWEGMMEPVWIDEARLEETRLVNDDVLEGWVSTIVKTGPQIVGFSLLATNFYTTIRLARKLKLQNSALKIVFGGPQVYRLFGFGQLDVFGFADALILGEGEETLLKAVLSLEETGQIMPGEGILTREGPRFVGTDNQHLINPLDVIPFPKYEFFPLKLYKEKGQFPLIFSRGCIGRCAFCFEKAYWKGFRQRSVNNVIQEILLIREQFGIYCFSLNDSLINGDMRFLSEFCERVIREKIQVSWWGMARVNALMSEEFVRTMKQAGCESLAYGIESGSQRVLDLMQKNYTIALIDEVITNTWKSGIKPGINLLLGFPGEEESDFQQTCELVKRHGEHVAYVNVSMLGLEPFTKVYAHRHEMGIKLLNASGWQASAGKNYSAVRKERVGIKLLDTCLWQTFDGKNDPAVRVERAKRLSEIIERYVGKSNNFASER